MTADTRPLLVRLKALAQRFDALAIGARKQPKLSPQIAQNHARDATTLHEAVKALEAQP